ncbi:GNAT family N-acetyltransferase [Melittangium boletus]|uniref:GNAT family N-acetyltransferase n=1 Tax=Melittangium boletus TaxID=83453 RepID=UPI003DA2DB11
MAPPLHADAALARRLEHVNALTLADYAHGCARLLPDSGSEVLELAGGKACFTRPDLPINRAAGLAMAGPITPAELDRLEAFYRDHGVPPAVEACPLAHPSLYEGLGARGYRVRHFLQVAFHPLGAALDTLPPPPAGLEVSLVGEAERETWVRTLARGFGEREEDAALTFVDLTIGHIASTTPRVRLYLARHGGEVVAGAGLRLHEGIATLFGAATRVGYRRLGAQTALIHARLRDAQALGCELAMVATSPEGGSLANEARAGFRVAYTRVLMEGALTGKS